MPPEYYTDNFRNLLLNSSVLCIIEEKREIKLDGKQQERMIAIEFPLQFSEI